MRQKTRDRLGFDGRFTGKFRGRFVCCYGAVEVGGRKFWFVATDSAVVGRETAIDGWLVCPGTVHIGADLRSKRVALDQALDMPHFGDQWRHV
jgi:hypothetical protein